MNTTEIRELSVAELDLVSGGERVSIKLPGAVGIQLDTQKGCWSVWLDGAEFAYGGGKNC